MGTHLGWVSWLCWLSTGVYASAGHSENASWILPFGFRIKPFFFNKLQEILRDSYCQRLGHRQAMDSEPPTLLALDHGTRQKPWPCELDPLKRTGLESSAERRLKFENSRCLGS